ncbi:serine hydrolase domain-containing protein [Mobilicoccus massiliensis]|uniref:serine hydrolase domain-containing protein n=1 Tax=Mobilicoccus massiliensis TaxID=1522310 RepID=UPI000693FDD5|nr:serine hydrolase domain-containing protein [Mobilicoccus massiliensis]
MPASTTSAPPATASGRHRILTSWAIVLVALLVGGLGIGALAPRTTPTSDNSGDAALAAATRRAAGDADGFQSLSVARIENGRTTYAGVGTVGEGAPSPETTYELGSITKTFTGMLLADAVKRREMSLDSPLSTYLPELAGSPAGGTTPRQLATHTSGLPRLPADPDWSGTWAALSGGDVYAGWTRQRLLDAAKSTKLESPGTRAYSNLGTALLGEAEARAAGAASWSDLARTRLLEPLGMTHTTFADSGTPLPAGAALPYAENGFPTSAWTGPGYVPAGSSTRTTAADMARFATAVLDGTAPGVAALDPVSKVTDTRSSGLAWVIDDDGTRRTTWHNGGTGGSHTMLALDRAAKTAVVVLGNSSASVDHVGIGLLREPIAAPSGWSTIRILVCAVGLAFIASPWLRALRPANRIGLATGVVDGVIGGLFLWRWGPWHLLPHWVLGSGPALAVVGVVYALMRMPEVPTRPAGRFAFAAGVVSLLISVVILVVAGAGALP